MNFAVSLSIRSYLLAFLVVCLFSIGEVVAQSNALQLYVGTNTFNRVDEYTTGREPEHRFSVRAQGGMEAGVGYTLAPLPYLRVAFRTGYAQYNTIEQRFEYDREAEQQIPNTYQESNGSYVNIITGFHFELVPTQISALKSLPIELTLGYSTGAEVLVYDQVTVYQSESSNGTFNQSEYRNTSIEPPAYTTAFSVYIGHKEILRRLSLYYTNRTTFENNQSFTLHSVGLMYSFWKRKKD